MIFLRGVFFLDSTAVFGVTLVDIKGFPFEHYISAGRNLGSVKIVHGGVSRNVCEDFANVGMPVEFVSVTDKTCIGQDVVARLNSKGVGTKYITSVEENGIGMWLAVMDENGNLAGSVSQMPDVAALEKYIDKHGDEIASGCKNIILEMDASESISAKVLALAEKYRKAVYVIVGNMSVILAHPLYLCRTACFICNEIEAGRLFDMYLENTKPAEMLCLLKEQTKRMNIPSMVITMGVNGAVYYDRINKTGGFCPSIPTELIDSTGAGDAFLAGTVIGLTKGYSLKKAVHAGTKLASSTIQVEESSCPKNAHFFDDFEHFYTESAK